MKIIFTFISLALLTQLKAQIAIGKTEVSGAGSLMEFAGNTATNQPADVETNNTNGIILPSVNSLPNAVNSQNGTFIFNRQSMKNMFYENGIWKDMSDEGNSSSLIPSVGTETGNGVIIGASTSSAKGVLIFESPDKALVLPHIKNPHLSVVSPYPGMMCYDTVSNSIAVFDGSHWSYWQ